jgi:hypothetical protein
MQVIAIHPNSQYQTVASIFCQTHHMHWIAIKHRKHSRIIYYQARDKVDCDDCTAPACGLRRASLVLRELVDGTRPWLREVGWKARAAQMVGECLDFGGSLPMLVGIVGTRW